MSQLLLLYLLLLVPLLCYFLHTITSSQPNNDAYPSLGYGGACDGPVITANDVAPERRDVHGNGRIIDISHKLVKDMPSWESKEGMGQFLRLLLSTKNGSLLNWSEFTLSVHSGTHVDAPGHVYDDYFDAGFDVDTLDLEVLNGPALLVDVPKGSNITAEVMKSLNIPKGVRRVLFRTANTDKQLMYKTEFDTSYVGFMKDGAEWLVKNTDIKLVGLDYLSVAAYVDAVPTHLVFLKSRVRSKDLREAVSAS